MTRIIEMGRQTRDTARLILQSPVPADKRDRFRTLAAYAIVCVSVLGALGSWQASKASNQAGGLDQQAVQEQLSRNQATQRAEAEVLQDLQLLGPYEESSQNKRILLQDGLRWAANQARHERETLRRFFTVAPTRNLAYDPKYVQKALERDDLTLPTTRPGQTRGRAKDRHQQAVEYTRSTALLIGCLFFLTLAQLTRAGRREWLALIAGGIAGVAAVQFFVAWNLMG